MVLSASDLGIREGLEPFFCYQCGNRIGWTEETNEDILKYYPVCEDCAKLPKEEDEI